MNEFPGNRGSAPQASAVGRPVHWFHSIRVKTWSGVLLITILPLVVLSWYAYRTLADVTHDLLIKSNLQAFQRVKSEIDQYVQSYVDLIRLLQNDSRFHDPLAPEATDALRQLRQSFEFIEQAAILDASGTILNPGSGFAISATASQTILPATSLGLPERAQQALTAPTGVVFSPGMFFIKAPLAVASPSCGLLVRVSFRKLRKTLEGMSLGTSFHFYLLSRNEENLLDQKDFPASLTHRLLSRPYGAYDLFPPGSTIPAQVVIILPILHHGLRVVIIQEASEVYAILVGLKRNFFLVIIFVSLTAGLFGSWFSLRLSRPIVAIANRATEIAGGNLRVSVRVDRQDEIGFLARCFNTMTIKIRKKIFELSALYKISEIINQAPTYQRALDDTLGHIVTIFLAGRGSIMLLGDNDEALHLRSVRSFGQIDIETGITSLPQQIVIAGGEGIAGRVVQSGEAILCADCSTDNRFKPYPEGTTAEPPHSMLCVPLVLKGRPFGVINLVDRADPHGFSEDDRDLLATIASQLSVSIDNSKLHELAITDGLTQLFIHRYFQIKLDDEVKRALRYSEFFSLILFDIDHFKKFNDTYGHQQGDTVLKEVARLIKELVRTTDVPCRYGGEEFTIILPHTNAEQGLLFAERVRQKIEAHPFPGQSEPLHVTISLGVAEFPRMTREKQRLVQIADIALYHCKGHGRNCSFIFTDEMSGENHA
ncbi:MAG: diguanylate cyclase [Candidatus Ozemobacteraceae bacterium]